MKQKILIIALLFCMIFSMAACSGNNHEKIATVTIEEEKYVLSGDFQEVVGTMVKNGLEVCETKRNLCRDE